MARRSESDRSRTIHTFNGLREPVPSSSPLSYPRRSALRPLARRVAVRRSPRTFRVRSAIESLPLSRLVLFASLSVPAAGSHHPVARRALLRRRQRFVRIPAHRLPQPASAEAPPFIVRAIEGRTRCGRWARCRTSPDTARVELSFEVIGKADFLYSIRDFGKGINPDQVRLFSNGMLSMKSRAEAIGCRLEITSIPGAGTAILLSGTINYYQSSTVDRRVNG